MYLCLGALSRSSALTLTLALAAALSAGQVVQASPSQDLRSLAMRIEADQAQLQALQTKAASEMETVEATKVAGLFGESDDEKAARLQHEQNQDSSINTLNQRLGDLEESIRRLTGQVEQLDHRISELNDRVTRMQRDFDYKLCSIAAQQLGATNGTDDQTALPCGGQQSGATAPAAGGGDAPGPPVHLSAPPGVLGTLPQSAAPPPPGAPSPTQLASTDTRSQFDAAMSLLAKAQYDEARAAFRSFVDSYPNDELAPQAIYWVGDIAYVQKDFPGAAHAFAEGLKKYPSSPRAPESMLKLGQSLIALNQKKEGCLALDAITNKYPSASQTVTERAFTIRRQANCR